jgi:uncharacterized membrane protein YraQ (UPF0718 family)
MRSWLLLQIANIGFWNKIFYNFQHSYTKRVIDEVIFLIIELLPYLIVGILVSTLIKQYLSTEKLKRILSGKNIYIAIVLSTLLGLISPLGAYVTIPLSAAMVSAGLPLAPVVAFMVSSPLINPGLFILTWGALGPEIAIARVLSAFLIGISAGIITQVALNHKLIGIKPQKETDNKEIIKKRTFWDEAYRYTKYISKHFLIGILLAAITKVLLPVEWMVNILGQNHIVSVLTATAAGIPLYSCGGAAIPVMQQLVDYGVDKGAILAFFISGPATKISNVVLLISLYKKGTVYIYFALSILGAILFGWLYHFI